MNVSEYVRDAESTDRLEPKSPTDANFKVMPILGLAGEIGSLLTELKKRVRDKHRVEVFSKKTIEEELGDIVWYSATLARRAGLNFQNDVLFANLGRIKDKPDLYLPLFDGEDQPVRALRKALDKQGVAAVATFASYQALASLSARFTDHTALVPYLTQVWKNSGDLFHQLDLTKSEFLGDEPKAVANALGDVMWYVAAFATLFDLSLEKIASENIRKALSMFPPDNQREPAPLFDTEEELRETERFPRIFDVEFMPVDTDTAVMLVNGLQIGDPLKDNAYQLDVGPGKPVDGYRFHDCIHLAFVAVLGWSPVVRSLMKRKRKTNKSIDDAEDGARAQIVEEMIVKLTHSYAINVDPVLLLAGKEHVSLDLLKQIEMLADGLEVTGSYGRKTPCKLWEWEKAILQGYDLFNKLREHKRGRVRVDQKNRQAIFSEMTEEESGRFPLPA